MSQNTSQNPKVTFITGVGTVTGSNFLVESVAGQKILVDCGMVQGDKSAMQANRIAFAYEPSTINALLVTHAHLDHVGRIPKLVKEGFSGPIYSTPETKQLAELVLNDAVGIIAEDAREDDLPPMYDKSDVDRAFSMWQTYPYHERFTVVPSVEALFKDAGHILGSAMIQITFDGKTKMLFSGDLGNSSAPLLRDTEAVGDVDYIAMESTYGDRNHEPKDTRRHKLEEIINATISRGGTLVVPTFSIDRTQVLLYELNALVEHGRIKQIPIFLDSPMAIRATEIYKSSERLFNDGVRVEIAKGDDIFSFPKLKFTINSWESKTIESLPGAKIILAGSGMSVGGRVVGHEEHFLPDAKSTILLVGYQAVGSLGRQLVDGAKKVQIHGRSVKVNARIETLYGYSAHKDSDHLVEFVTTATERLKKVFVIMGEPRASMHLTQRLNDELDAHALVPKAGEVYELE